VTNTGAGAITLGAITLGDTADYTLGTGANACVANTTALAAGATCDVYVSFDPKSVASLPTALTVGATAVGTTVPNAVANLTGTGTSPVAFTVPAVTLTSTNANRNPAQTFTVLNSASSAFTVTSVATLTRVGGQGQGTFNITATTCNVGAIIPPNGTCTVNVTFTPTNVSARRTVIADLAVSGTLAGGGAYQPAAVLTGN
jgi:hypothetical protein